MRHVPDAVLRRLVDEPLAVPDTDRRHLDGCGHCRANSGQIAEDAALATRLLAPPPVTADSDLAWTQLQLRLADPAQHKRTALRVPRYPARRLVGMSVGTGAAVTAGVLVAGVAAAATLTTVFAPNKVAPVQVNQTDIRAIATMLGIGGSQLGTGGLSLGIGSSQRGIGHPSAGRSQRNGGPPPADGSQRLAFGTLRWTSSGQARRVGSIARARAMTGLAYTPPTLPAGVGSPEGIVVQPKVTATVRFSRNAGQAVGGSSLTVTGGPAMLVKYGSSSGGTNLATLGVLTMRRPVASSTGATASQLEAFLLARPGVPASLAQEIRLLGNPGSVLPVPVPAKADASQVRIGGSPGVLIADPSGAAAGVIWESRGVIHIVAGLLDRKDVLNVARQLG